jgi:ribosome biogenesis SPOUT family RNA methylase Rps3
MVVYVIEHLEEAMGAWCVCEYRNIAAIVGPENVLITNISESDAKQLPEGVKWTAQSVLELNLPNVGLLDLLAEEALQPADKDKMEYLLFGGILGDHPPRDRTSHLRPAGHMIRHLGPEQMSTDGAVHVCARIFAGTPLEQLEFAPYPLHISNSATSTVQLPFKYLKLPNGEPALPPGLRDLLLEDFSLDDWDVADGDVPPQKLADSVAAVHLA